MIIRKSVHVRERRPEFGRSDVHDDQDDEERKGRPQFLRSATSKKIKTTKKFKEGLKSYYTTSTTITTATKFNEDLNFVRSDSH